MIRIFEKFPLLPGNHGAALNPGQFKLGAGYLSLGPFNGQKVVPVVNAQDELILVQHTALNEAGRNKFHPAADLG